MSVSPFMQGLHPIERIQIAFYRYFTRPTANSTAAILIWIGGASATRTFLTELGVTDNWANAMAVVLALVLQALLTLLQGPVWHSTLRTSRARVILAAGSLFIDTAMNTGGCWYWLKNLGNTTFWHAITAATQSSTPAVSNEPAAATILALSFLLALGISTGPEALWDL